MQVEVIPIDRSYIELVVEMRMLAEALAELEPPERAAMTTLIQVMSAPRYLTTKENP